MTASANKSHLPVFVSLAGGTTAPSSDMIPPPNLQFEVVKVIVEQNADSVKWLGVQERVPPLLGDFARARASCLKWLPSFRELEIGERPVCPRISRPRISRLNLLECGKAR